ncbi:Site-specific DNA recombinase [Paenibacillus sp. UNCCL117]|uniref:recombinase family protein n=1 Tax=unclassified Paenibacillus TaxID=185978 RepID=UPI00088F957C|nr:MULTISPECIES: recombinase family protein [unclassified Paenibacillus]SDD27576.1 Site-specific DNA recombinase [Paenibacillus sp. cl123]SFW41062.1 Site-specific DNA recombinase [Paenibacillus sp. UNCCL117]
MSKKKKKKAAYVRVSTLKETQQDSPEHQESMIRSHASRMEMEIDHVYEDRDSATSMMSRDDVMRMIADAKRGEIDTLFFASLSRFSRDALDAISLKRTLVNALKVRVISIEDGYDSALKDDELLFGIKSVVNQDQSGAISVSSRRGINESAEAGNFTGSIAPYGYKKVLVPGEGINGKPRKSLEIVPEKAEIVRMIFELASEGMGAKSITKYLNGENPAGVQYPSYFGGPFGLTSVQNILKNENYTGYTVFGKFTNEVAYNDLSNLMDRRKKLVKKPESEWKRTKFQTHEAIISKELFDKVKGARLQQGGNTRGGRRNFVNVFAKLIFCESCGSAMVSMAGKKPKSENYEYRYLACSRRRRMGARGCNNDKWIPYQPFRDDIIAELIKLMREKMKLIEKEGIQSIMLGANDGGNDREKEKKKLTKNLESFRKLLFEIRRQHMLEEIDAAQYEFEKDQYEKDIATIESRLAAIEYAEKRVVDLEKNAREIKIALGKLTNLKTYDNVEKTRPLLMEIIRRIDINHEGQARLQTYL